MGSILQSKKLKSFFVCKDVGIGGINVFGGDDFPNGLVNITSPDKVIHPFQDFTNLLFDIITWNELSHRYPFRFASVAFHCVEGLCDIQSL